MDVKHGEVNLPNPKSRGNWGIRWRDGHYESIFGHSEPRGDEVAGGPRDMCQRHDFDYTRQLDGVLADFRKFPAKQDREKITDEYLGRQQEYRNKVIKSELDRKYGR